MGTISSQPVDTATRLLVQFARDNDTTSVQRLLQNQHPNVDDPWEGKTALEWAIRHDNGTMVRHLSDAHANLDVLRKRDFTSPILWAARDGKPDAMQALLERGVIASRVDRRGKTALHFAVLGHHLETLRVLLDWNRIHHVLRIDAQDYDSEWTALHYASSLNDRDAVALLLEHGADPSIETLSQDAYTVATDDEIRRMLLHASRGRVVATRVPSRRHTIATLAAQYTDLESRVKTLGDPALVARVRALEYRAKAWCREHNVSFV